MVVNFNTPIVNLLKQAETIEPSLAQKLIPRRIHPGASTQLAMAMALLQAWHAPATVTSVTINAPAATVKDAVNTTVTGLKTTGGKPSLSGAPSSPQDISWNQTDKSLPYPIMSLHSTKWPQFPPDPFHGYPPHVYWKLPPLKGQSTNPVAKLVLHITHMYQKLDAETLKVTGLTAPAYKLKIDGTVVGMFSKKELAHGVNLARYQTPMMDQADKVLTEIWHQEDIRFYAWRGIQVPLRKDTTPGVQHAVKGMLAALYHQEDLMVAKEHKLAQPIPHHYVLAPVSNSNSNVPCNAY